MRRHRLVRWTGLATVGAGILALPPAAPAAYPADATLRARDDAYHGTGTIRSGPRHGVLHNDGGRRVTLVSHTSPAHGTLSLDPDGSFRYVPAAGFRGTDRFTYTVTDAVRRYRASLPPLTTVDGVTVVGGGYGSALCPDPGAPGRFYGLTDRGPNVSGPDDVRIEPVPDFTPSIGRFRLVGGPDTAGRDTAGRDTGDGRAVLERRIPLRTTDGTPYNGRVNPQASTGERIVDLDGRPLPPDPGGYDPEGLVAMADGTFWVSDEYGPFITHFDADGRQLRRLSPFDGTLPAELANRMVNRGLEGLTITPDGTTLVGIMQSALKQPDTDAAPGSIAPVRIVTHQLRTGETHEYLYLLDDPKANLTLASEITALPDGTFLVVERDGSFPPAAYKRLWRIDLAGATDVAGLLVGGGSIEALVGDQDTAAADATLRGAGITPVSKHRYLDVAGLLTGLDPTGAFFSHDKLEGLAVPGGGRTVVIANDSDFGIDTASEPGPPYRLNAKVSPATGAQDDGELLEVDLARLPAATRTATVTLTVG